MADNVAITAGAGTTIAADDISGVLHQRVKLSLGADGAAADAPVGPGPASSSTLRVALADISSGDYETVAASQADQSLGASGATGDYLSGVLIVPATLSPGAVSIKDGSGSAITIFAGGTDSVLTLHPFFVPLGIISTGGAWKITTGASVSAIGVGNFT